MYSLSNKNWTYPANESIHASLNSREAYVHTFSLSYSLFLSLSQWLMHYCILLSSFRFESCTFLQFKDIPGYFFRDDALSLHRAIHQFVAEYTSHYYRSKYFFFKLKKGWRCYNIVLVKCGRKWLQFIVC